MAAESEAIPLWGQIGAGFALFIAGFVSIYKSFKSSASEEVKQPTKFILEQSEIADLGGVKTRLDRLIELQVQAAIEAKEYETRRDQRDEERHLRVMALLEHVDREAEISRRLDADRRQRGGAV